MGGNVMSDESAKIHHYVKKAKYNDDGIRFVYDLLQLRGITKNSHIIDVCCGECQDTIHLKKYGLKVDGVDGSEYMLKNAVINLGKKTDTKLICSSIEDYPGPFEKYNAAYCLTSFGMLSNQEKAVENIGKMLITNGIFIFDFWNKDAFPLETTLEYDEDLGVKRHVVRVIKDGYSKTKYTYPNESVVDDFTVKMFDIWSIAQVLTPWFTIANAYSNYTLVPASWKEDKYVTIVAEVRKS